MSFVHHRAVIPEILDSLPPDDRQAQRSRRELRFINTVMGNSRWILSCLSGAAYGAEVHELGAGDGSLLRKIAARGFRLCGYDLSPRPADLCESLLWQQGDFLENKESFEGIVVGSLILHHLEAEELQRLGKRLRGADQLLFVEPLRSHLALIQGCALKLFLGPVTRHDMMVSIRAGFRPGELPLMLGLDHEWKVEEAMTLRGGYRLRAIRV
tara:strand:+ start:283 stop:918 length:636 start_codon:yes stop_codon:yes gene_type:complete